MIYNALVRFLTLLVHTFFRTVEVVGRENYPKEGPVVFCGNHPNSLIDPLLIITTAGRKVCFAAKDTLFADWKWAALFRALGAVPIKRRQDHGAEGEGSKIDNSEAFAALHQILAEGGAFGIFPEGISHFLSELQPLKTGAARIALSAKAEGIDVKLIPSGLSYRRRTRLRSRVLVQYGQPIALDDALMALYARDERAAARALTERIEEGLRALTINATDFDQLRVLDAVRRLYQPPDQRLSLAERAEISRRFLNHYERVKELPEVIEAYRDVETYQFKLHALGLTDADLAKPPSRLAQLMRVLRHLGLMLIYAPLALPGLILHAPILITAIIVGETITNRKDVVATAKLAVATLCTLAAYAGVIALFLWLTPWPTGLYWAPLVLVALMLSGLATIRVLERQSVLRRGLSVLLLLLNLKREVLALRETREELRARINTLVDRFIDADIDRIIEPMPSP